MAVSLSDNFHLPQDWQVGQSQSESTLCLFRAGLHADVWFCCKDQDELDKTDRIAAHKLILASRSPVFEAMFYGQLAEECSEIELPEIEKIPFLLFLRYLYSDRTDLSEDHAIDVVRIAHKYQVTTCLDLCYKFLRGILKPDNACYLLEQGHLLDDKDLVRAATDFIDDNVPAVIESDGFKDISQETLEYLLKGNTLFAPEVDIVRAVDEWATHYLDKKEMTIDSANKRLAMRNAFYYLRLPTLSSKDFMAAQLKYDYLTNIEQKNTSRYIIQKKAIDLCNSSEGRLPRKATYFMSMLDCGEPREVTPNGTLGNVVTLTCKKDIELEEMLLLLKQTMPVDVRVKCIIETSADKRSISVIEVTLNPFTNTNLKLAPAVVLHASNSPYKISVTITPLCEPEVFGFQASPSFSPSLGQAARSVKKGNRHSFAPAPSFGSTNLSLWTPNRISTTTQTGGDNDLCDSLMTTSSVSLESSLLQTCFIQGIKYSNKSYRDGQ